ncbi:MAG: Rrf2 family transcriptional regulator [Acidobacteria bacterium]|nr:Rrf2 family transcriptional regulator [Acidobacteriota bacterium]
MLRLSKKTDYGLLALQYLATEAPAGVASARTIAERYDIPVELLAKVLQHLARLGFVAAQKGVHGGYHLARPARAISLAEIVEAIDGPLAITACGRRDEQCEQFGTCTVRDPLSRVKDQIFSVLQTMTLAELTPDEHAIPIVVRGRGEAGSGAPVEAR